MLGASSYNLQVNATAGDDKSAKSVWIYTLL